ncbi:O-linked N-acetylglucosamine transferase, SPINDLY family protein [Dapis sp. BLCC M126]|uniref:O-linked N-acetylglucosamine transferase, SPINDLY family protein n=1 Tax=Dapis sp. BLCC M126 TaxID=3400189 RepID=UPI003CEB59D7
MISEQLTNDLVALQKQAHQYLIKGNYTKAASCFEHAIAIEPNNKSNYWYLGLMFLLQQQEEEAQMTWLLAMADGESEEIENWNAELVDILNQEASRQAKNNEYQTAWIIRQHIREIYPQDINNLLCLVYLSIEIGTYTTETLAEWGVIELLETDKSVSLNQELLMLTWDRVLKAAASETSSFELTKAIAPHIQDSQKFINILLQLVYEFAYAAHQVSTAIDFCKIGLEVAAKDSRLLETLAKLCTETGDYTEAIEYAQLAYSVVETIPEQLYQNLAVIKSMITAGGYWDELSPFIQRQKSLISKVVDEEPKDLGTSELLIGLYSSSFYFPYIQDNPQENLKIRQQISQLCQTNIKISCAERIQKYSNRNNTLPQTAKSLTRSLKIGYISSCFRRHSVGWLARGLFEHSDHEKFEIYTYMIASRLFYDPLKEWYTAHSDKVHQYGLVTMDVAEQIYNDKIDILIELDSLTSNTICGIMALKPAPIQVSWLGWDASAIPTIDYYIADPYILPEDAHEYYQEKIWRLPETFLAVDGFEVSVPTITRADLEIPDDAVVYLGSQRGPKYNPQIAKLQMQILREVPNSYYIIKGFGEQDSINRFFFEIAEKEGIARERIKFISRVKLEEIHRANLEIADIVLDTYPYNGATTTMETLWMCIPMVTRVGQQFAARNSYTMMMNAGITEGIAWSDEEYVEWGIRLGKDEKLRQEISWKLRKSRQTALLWNAKQFTREMEKAYEQMWQRYIDN